MQAGLLAAWPWLLHLSPPHISSRIGIRRPGRA